MIKKSWILLIFFTVLTAFLHFYKINSVPQCFNSDEAAFAYNAYSILNTGKDEYGKFMPTRFLSFGENKLPIIEYVSIPFIQMMGLNETASRMPIILTGILFPLLMFFLIKELTENENIALIGSFLASFSPWIQTMSRHIHEVPLASSFIILALIFLLRYQKKYKPRDLILSAVFNGLALFTYHSAKIFTPFFFVWLLIVMLRNKNFRQTSQKLFAIFIFLLPVGLFLVTDLANPTTRISNLLFFNNQGLSLTLNELRGEHDNRLLHNKLTQGSVYLINQYLTYFSPEFLVINGSSDPRFGFPGISPITALEYIFIFVGLYYLFKKKFKYRLLIIVLLIIAPITAVTTWLEPSQTRSFFLIAPIILIVSYGVYNLFVSLQGNKYRTHFMIMLFVIFLILNFYSWDFYFNHYPKRALVTRAWQCGYKELTDYVKTNYDRFDKFYITKKHGQPYIFLLFYLKYPPELYQKQSHLSPPDQYGFGQVERFDKFDFNFKYDQVVNNSVFIGYPDDFNNLKINKDKIKKIKINGEEIFWIYENL